VASIFNGGDDEGGVQKVRRCKSLHISSSKCGTLCEVGERFRTDARYHADEVKSMESALVFNHCLMHTIQVIALDAVLSSS